MEYRTPLSAKNLGSKIAKPTPKTTSRIIESAVDSAALPIACKKMKQALLTHASGSMQRYTRKARMAKSV